MFQMVQLQVCILGWLAHQCEFRPRSSQQSAFAKGLEANGCFLRQTRLQNPEGIGRGERAEGLWKETFRRLVRVHQISSKDQVKLAMDVVNITKKSEVRIGGFTPYQRVLGRGARIRGALTDEDEFGLLGGLEHALDSGKIFHLRSKLRYEARKCFVKLDCSKRV